MTSPRVIYFGIKTQRSAAEVGGWSNVDQMGLKDALTYDTTTQKYHNYTKSQITNLIEKLQTADLIVGFNQLHFDYKILSFYTDTDLDALPTFDMLSKIEGTLNFRVSRDNLAQNTLGVSKYSKGRTTLGKRIDTTKKLFAHGCKEGYLSYHNNRLGIKEVCDTSNWADTARSMIQKETSVLDTTEIYPPFITASDRDLLQAKPKCKPIANVDNQVQGKDQSNYANGHRLNFEKILQVYQETLQDPRPRPYYDPIGFTYDTMQMKNQLDPNISFQEFKIAFIELFPESKSNHKHTSNYKNGSPCYYYIDGSGTLAFERVRDYRDIRNMREELARGI